MSSYNDMGIENKLDWQRIRKLMIIGILAGRIANIWTMGGLLIMMKRAEEGGRS